MKRREKTFFQLIKGYLKTLWQYLKSPKGYYDTLDYFRAVMLLLLLVAIAMLLVFMLYD